MARQALDLSQHMNEAYDRLENGGVLLTVADADGRPNVMTIGWWLVGRFYHSSPVSVVAVTPQRHTFRFLEQVGEFVVCVPTPAIADAVAYCGRASGRDVDKFRETGLTPIPSIHVKPPSIAECPINVECVVYHRERPPHWILTPEHRQKPLSHQHTIYFAEIVGVYAGAEHEGV